MLDPVSEQLQMPPEAFKIRAFIYQLELGPKNALALTIAGTPSGIFCNLRNSSHLVSCWLCGVKHTLSTFQIDIDVVVHIGICK